GGKSRQIMVDLDNDALLSKGLSPIDVSNAINAQNVTLPSGTVKIGARDYTVSTNSSPLAVAELNDMPVRTVNGAMVYIRDVGNVRDGYSVQQNAVRRDGQPSVLLTIMKTGSVSTLDIVDEIKERILPVTRAAAPPGLEIRELFDQSIFVRGAIKGVVEEGIIAACLTGMMILLFLGSWRSTLIIAVSIPLSILSSVVVLSMLGHTLNVMTLGGLALAIGILVDDATVTIENIHRHMGRKPLREAVLDGAAQIATPTFVATLTICIVFVSVVFLTGPAKFLFTPMALAVVFAMIASYILSRTLVPVMSQFLLGAEQHGVDESTGVANADPHAKRSFFRRVHEGFNAGYVRVRTRYTRLLERFLARPRVAFLLSGCIVATALFMAPFVGRDFFPSVDAGQFRLHVRAEPGTRLEETKLIFSRVEDEIRRVIPQHELDMILDNVGRPAETFNYAFSDGATIGTFDGEILVALGHDHRPTAEYIQDLRKRLPQKFPNLTFYFQPSDIVSQILNFGLPAPIDIQVAGYDPKNFDIARKIRARIARIPGVVDSHVHQVMNGPDLHINFDRTRSAELGLTQQDVANAMFVSLSSSAQVQPNFWLDPRMGMTYLVAAQTPQYRLDSVNAIQNLPIPTRQGRPQLLSNLGSISHSVHPVVANHRNVQPVFDVYANIENSDLGSVSGEIRKVLADAEKELAPGSQIEMRGQVESMEEAFSRLGVGLLFAAVLVYLLMVVNFQSWMDPFIIITALPGAFCGIVWALFVTQTTFNVPSLMGAIMSIGVATANSILLVTFAIERLELGRTPLQAAIDAGCTRLRPICMTAMAMIIGMIPMALGVGEGGEQNAPLARAVIGGLMVATFATLFFVPLMFSVLRKQTVSVQEKV
ncbi:MAG TPA: efflux RND transporter permease subunit, partial [Bryobacteraceae bacterium]|nr:efflux RND transporter permease subunit [Bryobacteraceae bacterium]